MTAGTSAAGGAAGVAALFTTLSLDMAILRPLRGFCCGSEPSPSARLGIRSGPTTMNGRRKSPVRLLPEAANLGRTYGCGAGGANAQLHFSPIRRGHGSSYGRISTPFEPVTYDHRSLARESDSMAQESPPRTLYLRPSASKVSLKSKEICKLLIPKAIFIVMRSSEIVRNRLGVV